jgi:iron complex outermembrane receptor protein
MSIGGALDGADTPRSADKPPLGRLADWGARGGLTATLRGGDVLLHAGASRRARFPSLRELYSGALDRFEPNPALSPERLLALETGATVRSDAGGGELQAVLFHHRLNDAVVRVLQPDRRFKRVNRHQIRSSGIELIGSRAFGRLSLAADLSVQSVRALDPVSGAANRPENQPGVFGGARARFPLPFETAAAVEARYTGVQHCIDPGSGKDRRLDPGVELGGDFARTWSVRRGGGENGWLSRVQARVGVDNLADAAIYDQCGLPRAGRIVHLQLRLF